MPTVVLDLLKYVFLAVLYIFMAWALRAIFAEIRGSQSRPVAPARKQKAQRPPARKTKKAPSLVAVIEGDSLKGKTYPLSSELTIGRGSQCSLVLDDAYASTVHARLFNRDDAVFVEDMGSTNGTYLNRQKVTSPTELQRGDKVKIGKTVLEMRK